MDEKDEAAAAKADGAAAGKSGEKSALGRGLQELTGLVGLIAVVVGAWVSVEGLREKAKTDHETAQAQHETAEAQLLSAQEQTKQHQMDLAQQKLIHDADLQNKRDEAAAEAARQRDQRLGDVVDHIFSNQGSSEGEIAILSQFVGEDEESRAIVEKAVLARLETPRTSEEIDLGMRLFEQIGPAAWSYVAEVNRSARRRYDQALFARFLLWKEAHPTMSGAEVDDQAEGAVAGVSELDRSYDFATMNRTRAQAGQSWHSSLDDAALRGQQQLAAVAIARTNDTLLDYLVRKHSGLPAHLHLEKTYLEFDTVYGFKFGPDTGVNLVKSAFTTGAYLSGVSQRDVDEHALFRKEIEFYYMSGPPDVVECGRSVRATECRFSKFVGEAP